MSDRFLFSASRLLQAGMAFICAVVVQVAVAQTPLMPAAPQLAASSYVLMDAASGEVLVEQAADQPLPPASLTKIMTAYIVFEEIKAGRLKEGDAVLVSENAWEKGGIKSGSSTMFLPPNQSARVIDLLRGMIIQSGNDASIALAEHIAGGEEAFADMMNQQARLLGMNSSYFKNATGWPDQGHVSTARDMALLAKALILDHPQYYEIYSEKEFAYNNITQPNRNGLLWRDSSVDGIKTGYTEEAGYCLVSSAQRKGMRLVSVVMGTKSKRIREQESQKLLSYGFRYFQTHPIYDGGEEIATARVWAGEQDNFSLVLQEPLIVTIPRGRQDKIEASVEVDREIVAPVQANSVYGSVILKLDGAVLARRDLVAATAVNEAGLASRLWDQLILFAREILGMAS